VTGGTFTYDGALHSASATATGVGAVTVSGTFSITYNGSNTVPVNAGSYAVVASFTSNNTNYANATGNGSITINKAPSTITVVCPASVYFTGSAQTPCTASVSGAGGLSQTLTVTYTNNTFVGTATASASYAGDANHDGSSASKNFGILAWTLKGFYQPVDMNGVYNTVKNGSTVPLKFEIFSGPTSGLIELNDVANVKSLTYAQTSCDVNAITDDIETTATGGTSLRYDTTGGQFIYNWKTPSTAGKCYRVTMTTQDGSSLQAFFKTK
jgi:hypothetical protein